MGGGKCDACQLRLVDAQKPVGVEKVLQSLLSKGGIKHMAIVSCPECGSDFEIITVSPIELKPVEEEIDDDEEPEEAEDGDYS